MQAFHMAMVSLTVFLDYGQIPSQSTEDGCPVIIPQLSHARGA